MSNRKFTFVTAGKRDSYQIPVALHEAGLLDCMVVDYYASEKPAAFVPKLLRKWRDPALPRSKSRIVWTSCAISLATKALNLQSKFLMTVNTRALGRSAARTANALGSNLYCYHTYTPARVPDDACLIIFVYHPLPKFEKQTRQQHALIDPVTGEPSDKADEVYLSVELNLDWQRADAVVCASRFTAQSLIEDGCPAEKISVIPYGTPKSIIDRSVDHVDHRIEGGPARFLFVGQGLQRKGLHILIRAWETWRQQSSVPAELTIVSYLVEPEIRAMIQHPDITLLGYQSREELDRHFEQSDVFVLPSLVEGFGLVYLEAMSLGCHLIGTRNTGLPELPIGEAERTMVDAGSVESLVEALQDTATRAVAGEFDRKAIRAAAAKWTQEDFRRTIAEHARETLCAFESQLSRAQSHAEATPGGLRTSSA